MNEGFSSGGWVKVHRRLWEHPRASQPGWMMVWVYLLCEATHRPIKKVFDGAIIQLNPGQLIVGRKIISQKTKVGESTVQRLLETMENEQQIEQQTSNKNRLITIKNWEKYQGQDFDEQQNEQLLNNKRTTTEQPVNTLQEEKEGKNNTRERRERKTAMFEPPQDAILIFEIWKKTFPHDDAPRLQTYKNITSRLKQFDTNQLVFCILKYANRVKKETEERADGKVMTYKGSNFFGEKAYYDAYLPSKADLERPEVVAKIKAVLASVAVQGDSPLGSAGQGSAAAAA